MTAINITTEWKEIVRWSDVAATTPYQQNAEWRVCCRSEEDITDNTSTVYFKIEKSQSTAGHVENYNSKYMSIAGTDGVSESHNATMTWVYGYNSSTSWSSVTGDASDMYWGSVDHNADGSLTVNAHITGDRLFASFSIDTYVELSFPTIPRASKPTVSSNPLTIGQTQTISTHRASSSFTHTLTITMGSYSHTITGVGTSTTWTPSTAEFMPLMTSWEQTVTVTCVTYSGNTQLGSASTTFKLRVDTSVYKPVITWSNESDTNATTVALETSGTYIKDHSLIQITAGAQVNDTTYGDKLARIKVTLGSQTQSGNFSVTSGAVVFSGTVTTNTITAVATDSRGYSVTATKTLTLVNYQPISISSVDVARVNANGDPTETGIYLSYTVKGKAFQGSFGQASNTVTVKTASKSASASSYDPDVTEKTVTPSGSGYADYTITGITVSTYSSSGQFDVIFKLTDALTTASSIAVRVHEGVPVVAWGEDHFDVYGQFHIHDRSDVTKYMTFDMDSVEVIPVTFNGASGGSVNWTVFKFGSFRIATCKWTSASNVTIGSSWATILTSADQNTPNFPFTFANVLHKSIKYVSSANAVSADCWNAISASVSNTNGGQFYLVRPNDSGSVTANSPVFTMLVIGTV